MPDAAGAAEPGLSEAQGGALPPTSAPGAPPTLSPAANLPPSVADLGALVSRQLADAVALSPNRRVELTLAPEELGRVRMTLHSTEVGITVSVQAERPETLELLRRNIDQLARDFRDLGYSSIGFSFGDRPQGQTPAPQQLTPPEAGEPTARAQPLAASAPQVAARRQAAAAGAGLDLRI